MPNPTSTRKTRSAAVEPLVPSEKTKAQISQKKAPAPKSDDVPSQLVADGIATTTPAPPKKRGRKPKNVEANAGNPPSENLAEVTGAKTTDETTGNTQVGSNLKSKKAPVPTRDPLPAQEGRNTHPGLQVGLQPTPRRSSQQVAVEREQRHQNLLAQLQAQKKATDEVKQMIAQMGLEQERTEEAVAEEGRQRLTFGQSNKRSTSGDEDFDLDGADDGEEDDSEPEKEVSTFRKICDQLLTTKLGQRERESESERKRER